MKKVIERQRRSSGELVLQQQGKHYEIISGGVFLMSTTGGEGEREMVRLALSYCQGDFPVRVLVGGLGVGYSILEAFKDERVNEVDVVELEKAIIDWNKKYFYKFNYNIVNDERVNIICDDLVKYLIISEEKKVTYNYDVMIIDIDNGPDWLVRKENRILYEKRGLSMAYKNLSSGGVLVIWSATSNSMLTGNMGEIFDKSFVYTLSFIDEKERKYNNYLYFGVKN